MCDARLDGKTDWYDQDQGGDDVRFDDLPPFVRHVLQRLHEAGYQAYLVGGSVRDLLLGLDPADYDVATDAHPEDVIALFPRAVAVGASFGTVYVPIPEIPQDGVHVTTLRYDLEYHDGRRPTGVVYTPSVHDDLARRDFTINAMAWDPQADRLIDPFGGQKDLKDRWIRAVGDPVERFREDALRMLRAVRFATQFHFDIDATTWRAIEVEGAGVRRLSAERVRDEFFRLLGLDDCGRGLWMLVELGLFFIILPELKGADRMLQAKKGAPTLLDHLIQAAANCPADPVLRFAALLHDVGKLHTRTVSPDGRVQFHGHAKVGAAIAEAICRRFHLSRAEMVRVVSLVEMHMVFGGTITKKTLRRWIGHYGVQWVRDLVTLGRADWGASGWRGDTPDLDAIEHLLEEVLEEDQAFTLHDLAVDGHDIMDALGSAPGPHVGRILNRLYEVVLEDPSMNQEERLLALVHRHGREWALEEA